ncbi:FAD-binding domain-containing protein [Ilumatobacter sp.]|uniref:FAD-binding domain-containing protein n=1 Tax=Ilumatobacter sp. TaxID=1967498 RepID=UPI003B52502B
MSDGAPDLDPVPPDPAGDATPTRQVAVPETGRAAAEAFVAEHLGDLCCDEVGGSSRFHGGQRAADASLAAYDVAGYAAKRNQVLPESKRGASALSPHIRHGLLPLRRVWDHVAGGPARDVRKFRDELLWQEFSRHWYARLGGRSGRGIRRELADSDDATRDLGGWDRSMACMDATVGELERDGWLVNQTRMWLSSQWAIRDRRRWQDGEDAFFTHLLDGSRAANRLGWQWTTGVGSSKHYGFSRWQVAKRAPELCASCELRDDCPIEGWPPDPSFTPLDRPAAARRGTSPFAGPTEVVGERDPDAVWLTAESLGDEDPALAAHPDLAVVFTFDRPLLARLGLSSKRLVFLTETLAELAEHRDLDLHVGDPVVALGDRPVAVTHAPVPGFAARASRADVVETHPWPWLTAPTSGSVSSFSAWRKGVSAPS